MANTFEWPLVINDATCKDLAELILRLKSKDNRTPEEELELQDLEELYIAYKCDD